MLNLSQKMNMYVLIDFHNTRSGHKDAPELSS